MRTFLPAGEFISSILIGDGQKGFFDKPKDLGQATVKQPTSIGGASKECEHWRWTETILRVIPMSTTNFYVDMNAAGGPAPFFSSQVVKPFNKPIGVENASFVGYKEMDVSDYFDIDPDSVGEPHRPTCQGWARGNGWLVTGGLCGHASSGAARATTDALLPPPLVCRDAHLLPSDTHAG